MASDCFEYLSLFCPWFCAEFFDDEACGVCEPFGFDVLDVSVFASVSVGSHFVFRVHCQDSHDFIDLQDWYDAVALFSPSPQPSPTNGEGICRHCEVSFGYGWLFCVLQVRVVGGEDGVATPV